MPIITLNTGFSTCWQVNTYILQNTFKVREEEERREGDGWIDSGKRKENPGYPPNIQEIGERKEKCHEWAEEWGEEGSQFYNLTCPSGSAGSKGHFSHPQKTHPNPPAVGLQLLFWCLLPLNHLRVCFLILDHSGRPWLDSCIIDPLSPPFHWRPFLLRSLLFGYLTFSLPSFLLSL